MSNLSAAAQMVTVPWGDDKVERGIVSGAATYYPGGMLCLDSSGWANKAADTAGLKFWGIQSDSIRVQVFSDDSSGARVVKVERPFRFSAKIASAVAGDENKPVYALDDQTVSYTATNYVLVGWVDEVLSSTLVLIRPVWAGGLATSNGLTPYYKDLLSGRNSDGSVLAAAAASGKFGVADTVGTSLALVSEAAQNNTKTDTIEYEVTLPQSYVAGNNLNFTLNAQHVEASGTTLTNTLNLEVYLIAQAGTEGAGLVGASASAITGSAANYVFTATGTTLTPGCRVHVKITSVATEGGNTGTTKNQINSLKIG